MPECRLVVLGLSAPRLIGQDAKGAGKSSLCFRFVHPQQEQYSKYGEDHESVVSAADFQDAELNNDHFVYFGKARRDYLPSGSSDRLPLTVHVVEQTEFVDDVCYRPLGLVAKPYHERATVSKLSSPGKVAYHCRSTIGLALQKERDVFPSEFKTNGVDGYLFVLDPTSSPLVRLQQMKLLDECLGQIPKKTAVAVVVTKCDALSPLMQNHMENADFDLIKFFTSASTSDKGASALSRPGATRAHLKHVAGRMELKRKALVVPYFCTSSRVGIGVDQPFLYLAHIALRLPGTPPAQASYVRLTEGHARMETELQSAVKSLLRKHVSTEMVTWAEMKWKLRENTDFQRFEELFGEKKSKELFCARLVEIGLVQKHSPKLDRSSPLSTNETLDRLARHHRDNEPAPIGNPYVRGSLDVGLIDLVLKKRSVLVQLTDVADHPDLITFGTRKSPSGKRQMPSSHVLSDDHLTQKLLACSTAANTDDINLRGCEHQQEEFPQYEIMESTEGDKSANHEIGDRTPSSTTDTHAEVLYHQPGEAGKDSRGISFDRIQHDMPGLDLGITTSLIESFVGQHAVNSDSRKHQGAGKSTSDSVNNSPGRPRQLPTPQQSKTSQPGSPLTALHADIDGKACASDSPPVTPRTSSLPQFRINTPNAEARGRPGANSSRGQSHEVVMMTDYHRDGASPKHSPRLPKPTYRPSRCLPSTVSNPSTP